MHFTVPALPTRVLFGTGTVNAISAEVAALGASRVMLLASHGRADIASRVATLLGERHVYTETRAAMHVPSELVDAVARDVSALDVDLVVAIGGGSTIGMAKAIALQDGPPMCAVPTTYSGSEMTPIWGMTRDSEKTTGRDDRVRARVVFYDPTLVANLPLRVAAPSAINALAHCIEALYAPDASPLSTLGAQEGASALVRGLQTLGGQVAAPDVHTTLLYGAWLAGMALGSVQMGLHHKLAHVLGGSFALPHAETHAVLLPYTVAFNTDAAWAHLSELATLLDANTPNELPRRLQLLIQEVLRNAGAPTSLEELGLRVSDIEHAATLAVARPYPNPAPLELARVRILLHRAWTGAPVSDA